MKEWLRRFFNPKKEVIYTRKKHGYVYKIYAVEKLNGKWCLWYHGNYIYENVEFILPHSAKNFIKHKIKEGEFEF